MSEENNRIILPYSNGFCERCRNRIVVGIDEGLIKREPGLICSKKALFGILQACNTVSYCDIFEEEVNKNV